MARTGSGYLFIEKDPIIDLIRTEIQRLGGDRITTAFLEKISLDSGVSVGTLRNWFFGKTQRPQSLSTRFVIEAIGITVKYFRADGVEIRKPKGWRG